VNALQLEAVRRRAGHSGLFLAKFVLRTNCYFPSSDQNSDIVIRSSDHLLTKSNH